MSELMQARLKFSSWLSMLEHPGGGAYGDQGPCVQGPQPSSCGVHSCTPAGSLCTAQARVLAGRSPLAPHEVLSKNVQQRLYIDHMNATVHCSTAACHMMLQCYDATCHGCMPHLLTPGHHSETEPRAAVPLAVAVLYSQYDTHRKWLLSASTIWQLSLCMSVVRGSFILQPWPGSSTGNTCSTKQTTRMAKL